MIRTLLTIAVVFVSVFSNVAAFNGAPEYVSSCLWSGINDVVIEGDYAYCTAPNGLMILNISNLPTIDSVSYLYLGGNGESLVKRGDLIYMANGSSGLSVINVADPANPYLVGSENTPDWAFKVFVADTLAYVADYDGGLQIIDISDPANPNTIGDYTVPGQNGAVDVYVVDTLAYVADWVNGFFLLNVSDPAIPTLISSYEDLNFASGVYPVDTLVYIADKYEGLVVLNLAEPDNPDSTAGYSFGGLEWAEKIIFHNDMILMTISNSSLNRGLFIIDVADPENPALLGQYKTDYHTYGVAVAGNLVYLATNDLEVVDITDPESPDPAGSYETAGYVFQVFVRDNIAYTLGYEFNILDISDITNPVQLASYNISGYDLRVDNNLAYIAAGTAGLRIIDISDPSNPDSIGAYATGGIAYQLFPRDTLLYIAAGNQGLEIINVATPATPSLVRQFDITGSADARGVCVMNNLAFVTLELDGLQILDVSDPANPVEIAPYATSGVARGVVAVDGNVYIADGELSIVNVSTPSTPLPVNRFMTTGYTYDLNLYDTIICAANPNFGVGFPSTINLIDISDPASAVSLASTITPDRPYCVFARDTVIFTADNSSLIICKVPFSIALSAEDESSDPLLPDDFTLGQNFPNPFNPSTMIEFNLPKRSQVTLTVFNLLGQQIAELANRVYPAGKHRIYWDGNSSDGRRVSTGVYLYRLKAGEFIETRKMLLLK